MIEITVTGAAEERVSADLAQLVATVTTAGASRNAVLSEASGTQAKLVARAKELVAAGTAVKYVAEAVSTYANSWRNEQGETVIEHHAQSTVRMLLTDLERVGELAAEITEMGANTQVNWQLTPELRTELTRNLRSVAVGNAHQAAQDYADAVGAGSPQLVSLRDGQGGGRYVPQADARFAMAAAPEVTRGEVTVGVNLEATFNVS